MYKGFGFTWDWNPEQDPPFSREVALEKAVPLFCASVFSSVEWGYLRTIGQGMCPLNCAAPLEQRFATYPTCPPQGVATSAPLKLIGSRDPSCFSCRIPPLQKPCCLVPAKAQK